MSRFLDIAWRLGVSLSLLTVAISCSTQPSLLPTAAAPAAAPSTSQDMATSAPLPAVTAAPTAAPSGARASSTPNLVPAAAPTSTPAGVPSSPTVPTAQMITLADSGRSISMQPMQRLEVSLGSDYDWQIRSDDTAVLSLVPNSAGPNIQGVFVANQAGQANLSGTGNPKCLNAVPRCLMPSRLFQLHVTVPGTGLTGPTTLAAPSNIGLADNGKTITLHTGDRVTLQLGTDHIWDEPVSTSPNVLSRVIGILAVRGAQGVYQANAVGKTTLETNGRVNCAPDQMCPQLMLHFAVQIDVR